MRRPLRPAADGASELVRVIARRSSPGTIIVATTDVRALTDALLDAVAA